MINCSAEGSMSSTKKSTQIGVGIIKKEAKFEEFLNGAEGLGIIQQLHKSKLNLMERFGKQSEYSDY